METYEVLLKAGKYKVEIRAPKEVGEKGRNWGSAHGGIHSCEVSNDKTELEKEVKEGENTLDFRFEVKDNPLC